MVRKVQQILVLGITAALFAVPASASAWTRTARLGALPLIGDSSHRIAGSVTWDMPSEWTRSITEVDILGVRFWPSNPAPGCHALSVFTFQGAYTKAAPATRLRLAAPVRAGGALLGAGNRPGGTWRLVQNNIFAEGMPVVPGAHYVDGAALLKVGTHRYLELAFRSYSDGTCTASEVTNSNVVSGAIAFLRDANWDLRVIGKWPAGVSR